MGVDSVERQGFIGREYGWSESQELPKNFPTPRGLAQLASRSRQREPAPGSSAPPPAFPDIRWDKQSLEEDRENFHAAMDVDPMEVKWLLAQKALYDPSLPIAEHTDHSVPVRSPSSDPGWERVSGLNFGEDENSNGQPVASVLCDEALGSQHETARRELDNVISTFFNTNKDGEEVVPETLRSRRTARDDDGLADIRCLFADADDDVYDPYTEDDERTALLAETKASATSHGHETEDPRPYDSLNLFDLPLSEYGSACAAPAGPPIPLQNVLSGGTAQSPDGSPSSDLQTNANTFVCGQLSGSPIRFPLYLLENNYYQERINDGRLILSHTPSSTSTTAVAYGTSASAPSSLSSQTTATPPQHPSATSAPSPQTQPTRAARLAAFFQEPATILVFSLSCYLLGIGFQGGSLATYFSTTPQPFDGSIKDPDFLSLFASFWTQTIGLYASLVGIAKLQQHNAFKHQSPYRPQTSGIKNNGHHSIRNLGRWANSIGALSFGISIAALGLYFLYTTLGDSCMQVSAMLQVWIWMMMAFDLRRESGSSSGSSISSGSNP